MPDPLIDNMLAAFTAPQPYTMEAAADAPRAPGVHVVLDRGTVIYVGRTGNLRNRLRQHLTGNRESSVLHEQVGQLLDRQGSVATAQDIAGWLGHCEVRWQETDNPEGTKEALVLALKPRFNRQVPKPRRLGGVAG
ncbi:GIY-YIG nuclease family protein [Micromonospora sp. H33]|uniref:GIY-YIG nuclease family protein n=1 Tax=Micromonospora sp. H33 TaxID=3452215 RepID=UPI003F8966B9